MASVTGLTAARMLGIEASSVVSGAINSSGHLILTTHGGSQIDAGNALVSVPVNAVVKYLDPAGYTNATLPADYPYGVSLMWMSDVESTADWATFAGKWGSLQTTKYSSTTGNEGDITQVWTRLHGAGVATEQWVRSGNTGYGWGNWQQVMHMAALNPSSFTQSTALGMYPQGQSRLYFTDTNAPTWDFSGSYGEVVTFRDGPDFAVQTWRSHRAGVGGYTSMWQRTANVNSGWGPWVRFAREAQDIVNGSNVPVAGLWYRVAKFNTSNGTDPGAKASAEFVISSTGSGQHAFLRLRASVAYNDGPHATLNVEECSGYGSMLFTKARITSFGGTYDGHALDVYCGSAAANATVKVHAKHDDWYQSNDTKVNRWGSVGLTYTPTTPNSPETVLLQRGIGFTTGPIAPILVNNWANFNNGYETVGYQMAPGGIVRLSGLTYMTSGTPQGSTIFVLPEGCRPSARRLFMTMASDSTSRIDILTDGSVTFQNGTPWVSLEGISFQAIQ